MVQVAWAAVKVKNSFHAALYRRLSLRRGSKCAIVAVAHHIFKSVYHMLKKHESYREFVPTHQHERYKESLIKHTVRRFAQIGYVVSFAPSL
jgi:hypothetical protein